MPSFSRLERLRQALVILVSTFLLASCASSSGPRTFTSDRITVTTHGRGPDVVLIPGLDALASDVWNGVIADVPGYRYHVVQVAGFGGVPAGGNAGDGPVVEPVAGEIARYIEETRLEKPAVIGLSMGGSLAMLVASRHPALVSKVLIVDMVPFGGVFFGRPGSITKSEDARAIAENRRNRILSETEDARRTRNAAMVGEMIRSEGRRKNILEHGLLSDRTVTARAFSELIVLDLRQELARFHGPFTVLYVHAPLIPLSAEETDRLYATSYAAIPQAKLVRIPDSYHFIMLDQPERFARAVREFLR
jgi:pimeloyl-ACP methyl ester carboxylesterase